MKKVINYIYIVIFIFLFLIPLAATDTDVDKISFVDNRKLSELPAFGSKGFTDSIDAYLRDRIGFRRQMINSYAVINDIMAHELTHPSYAYGEDGYVYFKMSDNIQYSDYHKSFAEMVQKMQQYCESRGSNFYFMIEPEKKSTLRKHLPNGVNYDDSWTDKMLSYMDELGIHYINNLPMMSEKAENEAVFNTKYDAGHWNDLGCFYCTNNLFERINDDHKEVKPLTKSDYYISKRMEKTLANSDFRVNEEVPRFRAKNKYRDLSRKYADEIIVNDDHRHFHYYVNKSDNADSLPRMLVFQGSYYNGRPQFLFQGSSVNIGIHNYQNVLNLPYYYNLFQPDIVVFEVAEYTFSDAYFDSSIMNTIDWNPPINQDIVNSAEKRETSSSINIISGKEVSYLYMDRYLDVNEYAYLIINDIVYDFDSGNADHPQLSIMNEALSGEDTLKVLFSSSGQYYYDDITVQKASPIDHSIVLSAGASINEKTKQVIFTTDTFGNYFDLVVLQLIDAKNNDLVAVMNMTKAARYNTGSYYHEIESGDYVFRLKANSNLADEYISIPVYLEKGRTYGYRFKVDIIGYKRVVVENVEIFN